MNLYDEPAIDVRPVQTNTAADDTRSAVGGVSGLNQQTLNLVVMPDGKIRLPGDWRSLRSGLHACPAEKGNQSSLW